jgi:hypothetical protein
VNLDDLEGEIMNEIDIENVRWEVQALSHNGSLWEVLGLVFDDEKKLVYISLGARIVDNV